MDRICGEQTLYARTLESSATFGPCQGREVVFGRKRPLVHRALGDLRISREHDLLRFDDGRWWVHNGGRPRSGCPRARSCSRAIHPCRRRPATRC
ncbi:hypothetical protein [Pseudonocardia alni]|uniref:FHA domain-containing protein n=1 Tax=Pseudonocardia alni TaxID=33907 RepID=A0A852W4C0_PSEA5|nr:hypothetical protein [Pseudonocardia antarctica]NYG03877.1 hypothetical protein [Pseudonocardia antarctica]